MKRKQTIFYSTARMTIAGMLLLPFYVGADNTAVNTGVNKPLVQANVAQPNPNTGQASAAVVDKGELFYQLQLLREQVMQLQGQLEEQQYQLQQLQQKRLDDMVSLDRRINVLETSGVSAPSATTPKTSPAVNVGTTQTNNGVNEEQQYRDAYKLVTQRQFPEATKAFQQFLQAYPKGEYSGNALYWLGELYLVQKQYDLAGQAFTQLLTDEPKHRKAADASYSLGKVHHLQGNNAKAKVTLSAVIANYPNSGAAKKSEQYLQSMQ